MGVSPRVGVRIEQGAFFLASTFNGRVLILSSVARNDLMDCDTNPEVVDLGFIGSGATVSDIGPGATFSHSSLMSSENPSVVALSEKETHVVSVPMNVPEHSWTISCFHLCTTRTCITLHTSTIINDDRHFVQPGCKVAGDAGSKPALQSYI